MRYPYVESPRKVRDFASIYYDVDARESDGRIDVGSDKLLYSDVLQDIARLGGDQGDIVDTTLYWVSYEVTYQMMVSTTREPLEALAELWNVGPDVDFAHRVAARATELMSGAALVGALRAVAWSLVSEGSPNRIAVIDEARTEFARCAVVSGLGSLVADDAHAQFHVAERLKPGHDDLQNALVVRGSLLLAAAHALSLLEPWQPFIGNRLNAEVQEHRPMIDHVLPSDSDVIYALDRAAEEYQSYFATQTQRFEGHPDQRNGDDIGAYFKTRRDAPTPLRSHELSALSQELVRIERGIGRLA